VFHLSHNNERSDSGPRHEASNLTLPNLTVEVDANILGYTNSRYAESQHGSNEAETERKQGTRNMT